jgi:four helix bundle protein
LLKLTDADAENQETMVWLDFIKDCGYMDRETVAAMKQRNLEIGRIIGHMIRFPEKFMSKPR